MNIVNINVSIKNFSFKFICVVYNSTVLIASLGQSPISEIFILKIEILLVSK